MKLFFEFLKQEHLDYQDIGLDEMAGYLKSSKYGLLHQLVIKHFYGPDILKAAYKSKYIIEYIDNNGYECTYKNLALVPKKLNTSKGLLLILHNT